MRESLEGKPYFDETAWVTPANFSAELRDELSVPQKLYVHDVTLRDGEQTPGVAFTIDEKVEIAKALDRLGVDVIEAGLPMVPRDAEAMQQMKGEVKNSTIGCLVRASEKDIDDAARVGVELAVVEHSINPVSCQLAYGLDEKALIEKNVRACRYAADKGIRVNWMGWDAFRLDQDYVERVFRGVVEAAPVERVTIADTFGMTHPLAMMQFFKKFRSWFPDHLIELHTHNDYGLAIANALVAVTAGANGVHTSVGGLGERAGNIALEEFAMAVQVAMKLPLGLDLERLTHLGRLVERVSRFPLAGNKPVFGHNIFNVDSGLIIHILDNAEKEGFPPTIMMPYMPALVGRDDLRYVPGKGAGAAALNVFLDRAGLSATEDQKKEILARLKAYSALIKSFLSDDQFITLAKEIIEGEG